MKYTKIIIQFVLLILIITSCKKRTGLTNYSSDGGIMIEKFDSLNKNENRYNIDNKIYKVNRVFKYEYLYIAKEKEYLFERLNGYWKFIPLDTITSNTVKEYTLTIMPGLKPMSNYIPNYNQTVAKYSYGEVNNLTGIIENDKNLWMHPPRESLFKILELNPFPYIKYPYNIGETWNWELKIGEKWGDERWKKWKGTKKNKINYKIVDSKMVQTPLGSLNCYVVSGTAISELGETKLLAFFNKKYGFVKLQYINIDKSKINISLISVEDK